MNGIESSSSGQLISVVYLSSAKPRFDDADITEILRRSRKNNKLCGVTGMLLYRDGNILQLLEGPEDAVDSTFQRIQNDTRHHGLIVMKREPILHRHFAEWTMGFRKTDLKDFENPDGYSPFLELSFKAQASQEQKDSGHRMLLQFKANMR